MECPKKMNDLIESLNKFVVALCLANQAFLYELVSCATAACKSVTQINTLAFANGLIMVDM